MMTMFQRWQSVIIMFGIAALGSMLCSGPIGWGHSWGAALPGLYFLPIVVAGITLGIRAATCVACASGLAQWLAAALSGSDTWPRPLLETLLYVGVGITAAKISRPDGDFSGRGRGAGRKTAAQPLENAFHDLHEAPQASAFSQLVAGMVRRFRTPVASIEGAVWLLEDVRFPDEKREEFLRIIQKESHQLDRALSDIQGFTQPCKPRWQTADLAALIEQAVQRAGPNEHGPYYIFRQDVATTLPPITCDPEQIVRMLVSVLLNAIQATPGGGQITIEAFPDAEEAVIAVRDHGRGIPPIIIGRVFDPFFSTRDNALGLGLPVSRQIAAAHCGTITILETSGSGTCLTIRLRLNPCDVHEQGPHTGG